ncbi:MAG: hypothetical protein DWH73_03170 [Planctomycetota bacterium]|nr:MAG: hypothetical protein DWH73_03170 [Planctomycetota bacterium]
MIYVNICSVFLDRKTVSACLKEKAVDPQIDHSGSTHFADQHSKASRPIPHQKLLVKRLCLSRKPLI